MLGPTFLKADGATLHPVEPEDLPFVRELLSAPAVWRTLDRTRPLNGPASEAWLERRTDDETTLDLLVVDDGPVGLVTLRERNRDWGLFSVHFRIAPGDQGEGYATAAAARVAEYAVAQRRAHKLIAHVFAGNDPSCRLLESLGFEREGVHTGEVYVDGGYRDRYTYGLLAADTPHGPG